VNDAILITIALTLAGMLAIFIGLRRNPLGRVLREHDQAERLRAAGTGDSLDALVASLDALVAQQAAQNRLGHHNLAWPPPATPPPRRRVLVYECGCKVRPCAADEALLDVEAMATNPEDTTP
jgi:hypothetical protein